MIDLKVDGNKIDALDTVVFKACNLLKVQEGSIHYAPSFGIDLKLFFDPDIKIQNKTFEAYSIGKMSANGINPVELVINKETFREIFNYKVIEADTTGKGLIA